MLQYNILSDDLAQYDSAEWETGKVKFVFKEIPGLQASAIYEEVQAHLAAKTTEAAPMPMDLPPAAQEEERAKAQAKYAAEVTAAQINAGYLTDLGFVRQLEKKMFPFVLFQIQDEDGNYSVPKVLRDNMATAFDRKNGLGFETRREVLVRSYARNFI